MCACAAVAMFRFSVSTGELGSGDTCDTFMCVKAFSSSWRSRADSAFVPFESVSSEGHYFPQMEVTSCYCVCKQGIIGEKKVLKELRGKCLRKKRKT